MRVWFHVRIARRWGARTWANAHAQDDLKVRWLQGRAGSIALLGSLCLVLQQIAVPYTLEVMGAKEDSASLLHLHTGMLLAIAMLNRDRWVVAGCFAMATVGWMVRAWLASYDPIQFVVGPVAAVAAFGWTLACAHWMGWPKPAGEARVRRRDLIPFALVGLILFPLGLTVLSALASWQQYVPGLINGTLQVWFAKHFGVAILTFPLVMAWGERGHPGAGKRSIGWLWPLLLLLGVATSVLLTQQARSSFPGARGEGIVLMDYRFTLFAVLAWCMLRLRPKYSMPLLSGVMFALVGALAMTAERGGTTIGFINLLHLAMELSILLIAMLYYLVISRDGRELSTRLTDEAHRDTATGLPNLQALVHRILHAPPRRREIGYLLLDQVDSLRTGFGLDTQAAAMNAVASRIADMVQPYYVGTGQFALLPLDTGRGRDNAMWENLMARVEQAEIEAGGQGLRLLPYMGVAAYEIASSEAVDLALLTASHLAYEAKLHNEVRPLYDQQGSPVLQETQRQHMYDAATALACLRSERVVLYFQSIRSLQAHPVHADARVRLRGEVLCRLRDQQGELIMPARFMKPIEAAGRGVELDLAVLKALFRQLRAAPHALAQCERIAVNLTGQSLASASFRKQLRLLLADSPLPLSRLCFEITETAAISSTVVASQLLNELRRQGCSIAIDDFGVGMQSFERLKELPVDTIKIDGSFIRNVAQRGKDYALVQASVAVARAFGAQTVAEFVEDEETVSCLRELGVDWIQGYLVSQPQPLGEVLAAAS